MFLLKLVDDELAATIVEAKAMRELAGRLYPAFRTPGRVERIFSRAERLLTESQAGSRWLKDTKDAYAAGSRRLKKALIYFFLKLPRRLERRIGKLDPDIAELPAIRFYIAELGDLTELFPCFQPIEISDFEDFIDAYRQVCDRIAVVAAQQRRRNYLHVVLEGAIRERQALLS